MDDWRIEPLADENWRIEKVELPDPHYYTQRYYIHTPAKTLTMVIQSNRYTSWVAEKLLKEKEDIDVLVAYMPVQVTHMEIVQKARIA